MEEQIISAEATIETKTKLSESVLDYYKIIAYDALFELSEGLEKCESPIEQLLTLAINDNKKSGFYYRKLESKIDVFEISNQVVIKKGDKKYRVDLFVELLDQDLGREFYFAVECDGFEYHSSKEKFTEDRQRDRDLLSLGIVTIRLSGSEIVDNPHVCALNIFKSIYNYIDSSLNKKTHEFIERNYE